MAFWNDSPLRSGDDDDEATDTLDELDAEPVESLSEIEFPPGLVGDMAQYIFESSNRPFKEAALVASLALTAGIAGRPYNVSGMGLNLYLMLTAKTGRGKSGVEDGTDRLLSAVRPSAPMVDQFLGPGFIASGQAIHRHLDKHPSIFCNLGEFGHTLQQLCSPKANENQIGLKKTLLHLYGKSGRGKLLRSGIYAKTEDGIKPVDSPALTICCEGTPESFYSALSELLVREGLVSRFLVIDYAGPRPPLNKTLTPPSKGLTDRLTSLVVSALSMNQSNTVVDIGQTEEAAKFLDEFNRYCDEKINSSQSVEAEIYNRAHVHALKLSALVAVGSNHHQPVVTIEHARWATRTTLRSVEAIYRRFQDGDVGANPAKKAEAEIIRRFREFRRMTPEERGHPRYGIAAAFRGRDCPVVPYNYLRKRLTDVTPFKGNDSMLDRTLAQLVKAEVLVLLPKDQAWRQWKTRGPVYGLAPNWRDA